MNVLKLDTSYPQKTIYLNLDLVCYVEVERAPDATGQELMASHVHFGEGTYDSHGNPIDMLTFFGDAAETVDRIYTGLALTEGSPRPTRPIVSILRGED